MSTDQVPDSGQQHIDFEDFRQENGAPYWWGSDLMVMLGVDHAEFRKVVSKAIKAFMAAGMEWTEDFRSYDRDGTTDWKLSRTACYMTVMNADSSLQQVAKAQLYFAKMTESFLALEAPDEIERILIRYELGEANKSLASTARKAGVNDFARFVNAGYKGLYNMYNHQLAKKRGIESKRLIDHMGRTELAANLFRTTVTEEKIRNEKIEGQIRLEQAHTEVGRDVREMIQRSTGRNPEDLPVQTELPKVKKALKATNKTLKAQDSSKRTKGDE